MSAARARLFPVIPVVLALCAASTTVAAKPSRALEDVGDDDAVAPSGGLPRRLGLGLLLGEPSGLTAKLTFAQYNAVQAHLGYGIGKRGRLVLVVDYLFHFVDVVPPITRAGRLMPYVGIGGRLGVSDDDPVLGVRIPLGGAFYITGAPIEIFLEIAIGIGIVPETQEIVDGGLGGRFYF